MKTTLALGAALLALAACNDDGGSGNDAGGNAAVSNGQAAEANAAVVTDGGNEAAGSGTSASAPAAAGSPAGSSAAGELRPGEWEVVSQVVQASANAPAETRSRQPITRRSCMTAEESRQLGENFFGSLEGQQCSRREFTMRSGRIEGHLACASGGGRSSADITGEYTPTSFSFAVNVSGGAPGQAAPMSVQTRVAARRLGDCRPGSEAPERPSPPRAPGR